MMSDLTYMEKMKFEKLFGMGSGYVLNFSNSTFQRFISESISIDIYSGEYDYASCSKANLLRGFWDKASNHLTGRLLLALIDYNNTFYSDQHDKESQLIAECTEIAQKLLSDQEVVDNAVLSPKDDDTDFKQLSKAIEQQLNANEPALAIDRLHTYMMKYTRRLCSTHGIAFKNDEALHGIFGKYSRWLKDSGVVQADMTLKILGSSVKILDKFNQVRNNMSLAHDNTILNHRESVFIFNSICNLVKFIDAIEQSFVLISEEQDDDLVPF